MKAVILAGGLGTRIMEETKKVPKPMVQISGKPLLWHLIKYFIEYDFEEIIICGGYKYKIIRNYFKKNNISKKIKKRVINTGLNSNTGKRLKQIYNFVSEEKMFLMTYGDGLSNKNINKLINFHKKNKVIATVTAVKQPPRWGAIKVIKNKVSTFSEKNSRTPQYINGGFFVLSPSALKFIKGNQMWEQEPIRKITRLKQLACYKHNGFWQAMDTLREKKFLEKIFKEKAPWKIWR